MKNFVLFFVLSFFIEGVFGESVSVKEGDSVTLHTGLTEIQEDDVLEWRFGTGLVRIARVSKGRDPTTKDDVLDGIFRGRLKLDGQTGDLTIINITTEHAGLYEISNNAKTFRTFNVIVVSDDKKPSVLMGEYVTLPAGVTNTQMYDVIQWRFDENKSPIAKVNIETGNVSYEDGPDGRFKNRLQLDYWTGSLTITDTTANHTGVYEVDLIRISKYTIHKTFSVTVRGEIQSVPVKEGESITLNTDVTELLKYDSVLWMFGDTLIVTIQNNIPKNIQILNPDGRFRDRLKLDKKTGSLNITNTRTEDSGEYDVKIISRKQIIHKKFTVTVIDPGLSTAAIAGIIVVVLLACVTAAVTGVIYHRRKISELEEQARTMLSVIEGERLTLNPDAEHKDDKVLYIFKSSEGNSFTVYDHLPDDILKLDDRTVSSGVYELTFKRSGKFAIKRCIINPGENVPLRSV